MVGIFLDVSTAPVSGCTPDWLGASKNNCSEERGEAATLCTLCHWRCLCSTQIQHIWSNCSSAYWHWLLLWSSQDLQPNTEHLSKYYYYVGWFVFQSTFWSCSLWAEPSGQGAASRFKIQCFLWSSLRSPAAGAGTQRSAARNNNITKLGDEPSREGRKFRVSNFSLIRLQEPICFGCININLR